MIPIHLKLTNFLSYGETTDLDFSTIQLACISGNNGAGKSSLLDAMTWALFNKARRTDDLIIHGAAKSCEVTFDFKYEDATYRIQRQKTRAKTSIVDFYIFDPQNSQWKTISEKGVRDTDKVILDVLRMDYETFINASFFLQGKADQFATQKPGDRKRILSSILGLDIWEVYKDRALERRKTFENEVTAIDLRMAEINQELAEEEIRRSRLTELEDLHASIRKERIGMEKEMIRLRRLEENVINQKKTLDLLQEQMDIARQKFQTFSKRLQERQTEQETIQTLLDSSQDIQKRFDAWQVIRKETDRMNALAQQAGELEKKRSGQISILEKVRGALEQELMNLQLNQKKVKEIESLYPTQKANSQRVLDSIEIIKKEILKRTELESKLKEMEQLAVEKKTENNRLRTDMADLDLRRKELEQVNSPLCPLCGQDLTEEHRRQLVQDITRDGKIFADQFRSNQKIVLSLEEDIHVLESKLETIGSREKDLLQLEKQLTQIQAQLEQSEFTLQEWNTKGLIRLHQIETELADQTFAAGARKELADIDQQFVTLGYDSNQHEHLRKEEHQLREVEHLFQELEFARAKMKPLEREIEDITQQKAQSDQEIRKLQETTEQAAATYAEMAAQIPDLSQKDAELQYIVERESRINQELGAARQKVDVLAADKKKLTSLTEEREGTSRQIMRYKSLERAFGKDGVPALLIEQALPEIENHANDILDRLSAGSMNIRFLTRRELKTRDEKKETLEIQISDPNGIRDYELFSGGEAFRVNFAIRLALSRVLAQRAGARLQTLVIDEGFGSQDTSGRQRLIEAINEVKDDFALVLVITHLEELKDAFPNRIEVEKTPSGSIVSVL